jgi:hypothetical protein
MKFLLPLSVLLLVLALAMRLGAAPAAQDPTRPEIVLLGAVQTPHWDTVNLEDEVPFLLLRVPAGKRFVLTDLWLLSHERLPVGVASSDRMWLECVADGRRKVVFDSPVAELERPLRWETGVAFAAGQEVWAMYDITGESKRPRRVHFTGYWEDATPERLAALVEVR